MEDPREGTSGLRSASMPPIAHCVAFCSALGLVFAVGGTVLLSSGFPYRRLQLRIISVTMLAVGAILMTAAIVLTFKWHKWYYAARRQDRQSQRNASLVLRVPTVSGGTYEHGALPVTTVVGLPPPPAYEDVVRPPPSYENVMLMMELEKQARNNLAGGARRDTVTMEPAPPMSPVCHV